MMRRQHHPTPSRRWEVHRCHPLHTFTWMHWSVGLVFLFVPETKRQFVTWHDSGGWREAGRQGYPGDRRKCNHQKMLRKRSNISREIFGGRKEKMGCEVRDYQKEISNSAIDQWLWNQFSLLLSPAWLSLTRYWSGFHFLLHLIAQMRNWGRQDCDSPRVMKVVSFCSQDWTEGDASSCLQALQNT